MRWMEAAIISACLVGLLLAAGCVSPDTREGTTTPATIPGTTDDTPVRTLAGITHPPAERTYTFSIRLDRTLIDQGEPAEVNITIENLVSRPLTVRPFPPGIRVVDSCGAVVRTIPFGPGEQVIPPGETLVSIREWDTTDDQGVRLPPGRYDVELFWEDPLPPFDRTAGPPPPIPTRTGDIMIPAWDAGKVVVRYPEGARVRVITVDRTVTVAGLPVTLEWLECSGESVIASFLYPIASGTLPPGISTTIPPPPPDTDPGLFSVDGGTECPFSTMPVTPAGGLWRVKGDLPPVSQDAHLLTLIISELAGREGPWVFEVPLD
ncbi:MAG: hypothetical protein WC382_11880 [Methanoregulaceae archaeon]